MNTRVHEFIKTVDVMGSHDCEMERAWEGQLVWHAPGKTRADGHEECGGVHGARRGGEKKRI
jgi:hypothetical protein